MSRSYQAFGLMFVALFGLWGCARVPGEGASIEKLKAVESKLVKLESEFRDAASARDQMKKQLTLAEEAQNQLKAQLTKFGAEVKQKDAVIVQRTSERDQATANFEQFRNGLRDLLSKAEESIVRPAPPTESTVIPTSRSREVDSK
jgi:septal ring factor EnvC (AmiA/AmiB activator)